MAKEIVREKFTKYNIPKANTTASVCHRYSLYAPANIYNSMQTVSDDNQDVDFFNIPMDGIQESNELDEYLSQAIEKVRDPIAWWWDHQKVYPQFLAMALDYLSIPGTFQ
jgi:hypothetical protein